MFIDSHCHLDRIDLQPYQNDFAGFMSDAKQQQIDHMLCIAIDLEAFPAMAALVADYANISLSVGVHPNENEGHDPSVEELIALAQPAKIVAIGETGLDYFRSEGDLTWQHDRFRTHIRAAIATRKPLIIHTREAKLDTIRILKEEGAEVIGGVIHCFTEDWAFAKQAMALNFYISFSGIVTFNSAKAIQEVAQKVPEDLFLIETDSPYLAPVPFRGRPNYPLYVKHVAACVAGLRQTTVEHVAEVTSANFKRLFGVA
ncbi:MAG: TatD family hydrolase [Methylococcaceae bacterium]|nr:TatD family hydrolase [Methylococcaceae bacterium]